MDRREFIKNSGEVLFGKAVGLDALAEKYESNIFPEIQTNLKGSAWKDKNSYYTLRHKYFLTVYGIHFFPDDIHYFLGNSPAKRQEGIYSGGIFINKTAPN